MECKSTAVLLALFTKLDVMCVKASLPELVKNLIVVAVLTVVAVVIVNALHKSKVQHYANIINGMLVVVKLFKKNGTLRCHFNV
jgi:hypothetical protein